MKDEMKAALVSFGEDWSAKLSMTYQLKKGGDAGNSLEGESRSSPQPRPQLNVHDWTR